MDIQVQSVITQRTAKIVTSGNFSEKTKYIWIITHGYGMLASFFIKKFAALNPEEHYLVVPEALSRAYLEGLTGRVGASWMTSEERESEIEDQFIYLEKVYEQFITPRLTSKIQVIAFGFSQGAATIFRWANTTNQPIHQIVSWAGSIPPDVLAQWNLASKEIHLVIGDKDPFFPIEKIDEYLLKYKAQSPDLKVQIFEGDHNIYPEPLLKWVHSLPDDSL
jgi:predicted esterase